jgi:hypothetical protein
MADTKGPNVYVQDPENPEIVLNYILSYPGIIKAYRINLILMENKDLNQKDPWENPTGQLLFYSSNCAVNVYWYRREYTVLLRKYLIHMLNGLILYTCSNHGLIELIVADFNINIFSHRIALSVRNFYSNAIFGQFFRISV